MSDAGLQLSFPPLSKLHETNIHHEDTHCVDLIKQICLKPVCDDATTCDSYRDEEKLRKSCDYDHSAPLADESRKTPDRNEKSFEELIIDGFSILAFPTENDLLRYTEKLEVERRQSSTPNEKPKRFRRSGNNVKKRSKLHLDRVLPEGGLHHLNEDGLKTTQSPHSPITFAVNQRNGCALNGTELLLPSHENRTTTTPLHAFTTDDSQQAESSHTSPNGIDPSDNRTPDCWSLMNPRDRIQCGSGVDLFTRCSPNADHGRQSAVIADPVTETTSTSSASVRSFHEGGTMLTSAIDCHLTPLSTSWNNRVSPHEATKSPTPSDWSTHDQLRSEPVVDLVRAASVSSVASSPSMLASPAVPVDVSQVRSQQPVATSGNHVELNNRAPGEAHKSSPTPRKATPTGMSKPNPCHLFSVAALTDEQSHVVSPPTAPVSANVLAPNATNHSDGRSSESTKSTTHRRITHVKRAIPNGTAPTVTSKPISGTPTSSPGKTAVKNVADRSASQRQESRRPKSGQSSSKRDTVSSKNSSSIPASAGRPVASTKAQPLPRSTAMSGAPSDSSLRNGPRDTGGSSALSSCTEARMLQHLFSMDSDMTERFLHFMQSGFANPDAKRGGGGVDRFPVQSNNRDGSDRSVDVPLSSPTSLNSLHLSARLQPSQHSSKMANGLAITSNRDNNNMRNSMPFELNHSRNHHLDPQLSLLQQAYKDRALVNHSLASLASSSTGGSNNNPFRPTPTGSQSMSSISNNANIFNPGLPPPPPLMPSGSCMDEVSRSLCRNSIATSYTTATTTSSLNNSTSSQRGNRFSNLIPPPSSIVVSAPPPPPLYGINQQPGLTSGLFSGHAKLFNGSNAMSASIVPGNPTLDSSNRFTNNPLSKQWQRNHLTTSIDLCDQDPPGTHANKRDFPLSGSPSYSGRLGHSNNPVGTDQHGDTLSHRLQVPYHTTLPSYSPSMHNPMFTSQSMRSLPPSVLVAAVSASVGRNLPPSVERGMKSHLYTSAHTDRMSGRWADAHIRIANFIASRQPRVNSRNSLQTAELLAQQFSVGNNVHSRFGDFRTRSPNPVRPVSMRPRITDQNPTIMAPMSSAVVQRGPNGLPAVTTLEHRSPFPVPTSVPTPFSFSTAGSTSTSPVSTPLPPSDKNAFLQYLLNGFLSKIPTNLANGQVPSREMLELVWQSALQKLYHPSSSEQTPAQSIPTSQMVNHIFTSQPSQTMIHHSNNNNNKPIGMNPMSFSNVPSLSMCSNSGAGGSGGGNSNAHANILSLNQMLTSEGPGRSDSKRRRLDDSTPSGLNHPSSLTRLFHPMAVPASAAPSSAHPLEMPFNNPMLPIHMLARLSASGSVPESSLSQGQLRLSNKTTNVLGMASSLLNN